MSDTEQELREQIDRASDELEKTWPLYSYVTSNPLSGFEDRPFDEAVARARGLFGGQGYPTAGQFRQAWEEGRIDREILKNRLRKAGYNVSPEELLSRMKRHEDRSSDETKLRSEERFLNQVLEKWLSVFLDEGRSTWAMPGRENGFYRAWAALAPMDGDVPNAERLTDLPEDKYEAISSALPDPNSDELTRVFRYHLTGLPGWAGYVKQRAERPADDWSSAYPMDLADYLAVRLLLADHLNATVVPEPGAVSPVRDELDDLRRAFLEAWEETYRSKILGKLNTAETGRDGDVIDGRPKAQLVFCIDTRSEIIRRHIESTGPYETHGYAGFFGLPIRRTRTGQDGTTDACPPIVDAAHYVDDRPANGSDQAAKRYRSQTNLTDAARKALKSLQGNFPGAFSFVEFSGMFYGLQFAVETLFPGLDLLPEQWVKRQTPGYEEAFEPAYEGETANRGDVMNGLSLSDRVDCAQAAFELMGWDQFAPVVVFVGHESDTRNNPFDSSLCCGACAGNTGVPNARVLASICNEKPVREDLRERGVHVPDDTVFVAARHNTTTDEVTLNEEDLDGEKPEALAALKKDLETARRNAAAERVDDMPGADPARSCGETETRSSDWAQTRPEWGLAGNASFLIGPNKLRHEVDLEGRAFLHSYDWRQDEDGRALEQIMTGPLVVCQWINHQYYFSTVDNGIYGSGSKITHNPVGNFGVFQGNGGDLMGGLPLQSIMRSDMAFQHEPLRILNVIYAPLKRVQDILEDHADLRALVENEWIALAVMDPLRDEDVIREGVLEARNPEEEAREPVGQNV